MRLRGLLATARRLLRVRVLLSLPHFSVLLASFGVCGRVGGLFVPLLACADASRHVEADGGSHALGHILEMQLALVEVPVFKELNMMK